MGRADKLESECFYGRHDFKGRLECGRPYCIVQRDNEVKVSARRWFNKRSGTTYHSVHVTLPDGETLENPMANGYGDQYQQTAISLLSKHFGWSYTGFYGNLHAFLATYGHWATTVVVDVNRERDL